MLDLAKAEKQHANRIHEAIEANLPTQSAIAASWRRSMLKHGLSPNATSRENTLTSHEFMMLQQEMELLIRIADPILAQLFQTVGRSGCCVILSNIDGIILSRLTNEADDTSFDGWNLRSGSVWSEKQQGTNGIGTCAAEERSVLIHKDQHFCSRNIGMTCMGSPIFDASGKLMAVLDVSSARSDFTQEMARLMASLVAETANRIETEHFRASFANAHIVVAQGYSPIGTPLLASDRDELIIGANRAARRIFNLCNETFSTPIPQAEIFPNKHGEVDLQAAERSTVNRAIASAKGNMSAAAKHLNISRATFYRLLRKHNISPK